MIQMLIFCLVRKPQTLTWCIWTFFPIMTASITRCNKYEVLVVHRGDWIWIELNFKDNTSFHINNSIIFIHHSLLLLSPLLISLWVFFLFLSSISNLMLKSFYRMMYSTGHCSAISTRYSTQFIAHWFNQTLELMAVYAVQTIYSLTVKRRAGKKIMGRKTGKSTIFTQYF